MANSYSWIILLYLDSSPVSKEDYVHILEQNLKAYKAFSMEKYIFYREGFIEKKKLKKKQRSLKDLGFSSNSRSVEYYLDRGHSKKESLEIMKDIQSTWSAKNIAKKNSITEEEGARILSEFKKNLSERNKKIFKDNKDLLIKSSEGSLFKIMTEKNPNTGLLYTREEALEERKKRNKKYLEKVDHTKINYSSRKEYWIKKGYTEIEALEILKTKFRNTLEKFIKKYGEEEGPKKYKEKNEKWLKTMNSKSEEEKSEINLKKFKKTTRYSKKSISFFELLLRNISYTDLTFLYKEKEFFIYDSAKKKIFFYDFYIPELKIIIEYHGIMFHPKEDEINKKNWKCLFSNISYEDKMEYDLYKIKIAKDIGIDLLVIWEDENLNDAINKCLKIIKDKYDNYTREKNGKN